LKRVAGAVGSIVAASFFTDVAAAVSLSNHDERDHKVTIVEGESSKDHILKPAATLDGVCEKGCVIRLNDNENDEYELEGNEIVSIEDGYLYYDGPDSQNEALPGDGSKPPQGPKQ
jgi:hypothetical protein